MSHLGFFLLYLAITISIRQELNPMQHSIFREDCRLRLHYAGSMRRNPGDPFFNPLHNNPDVTELLLLCEGSGSYQFDGKKYEACARSVLFYNQGLWHEERSHAHIPFHTVYIGFSGLRLRSLPEGFFTAREVSPVVPLGEHYFAVEQRLHELLRLKMNPSPESQWISDQLLGVFIGELGEIVYHDPFRRSIGPSSTRTVQALKRFIHENYNRKITLEQLAVQARLSMFHLSRLFKKEIGVTPIQYVMNYRIEAAKQYLCDTEETMQAIAERIGYEDEAHFQHLFKRMTGMTPGQYRLAHAAKPSGEGM